MTRSTDAVRFARLRRRLAPPRFPELEKDRQASLINFIVIASYGCVVMALASLPWITEPTSRLEFFSGIGAVVGAGYLSRRLLFVGRVALAGRLLFGLIWIAFLILSALGSGLTSMVYLSTLALTPLLAGLLVGGRSAWLVSIVNFLLGGVLMLAEMNGRLPIGTVYDPPARFISYIALFGALPLMAYVWRHSFMENIDRYRELVRAQSEAALLRENKELLEKAVADATVDLADALARERQLAEELEKGLRREQEFSAIKTAIIRNLSHEFRTPLTVINTNVDLLWLYGERFSEEKKERYQGSIKASIQYLTSLLDDIRAVSQVGEEPPPPELKPIQFDELCRQLQAEIHYILSPTDTADFHCAADEDRLIHLPLTQFRAVVRQLVVNAAKFGARDANVRVTLRLMENELVLTVTDDGIGIPAGETEQIFDLFVRGSNIGSRRGLGLGLYLAQVNMQHIGGRLVASSAGVGKGATFTATVPLTATAAATTSAAAA